MSYPIFKRRPDGRTRVVEELVEGWKKDHHEAMLVRGIEDIVAECIDHQDYLEKFWRQSLDCAKSSDIEDLDEYGKFLVDTFARALCAYEELEKLMKDCEHNDYDVERSKEFRRGAIETKKILVRVKRHWPMTDNDAIAASLKDLEEGRTRPVKEILDEIRSGNYAIN